MSSLLPCERSASPHDLYDEWIKKYGRSLQSFWPVVDTEIGQVKITSRPGKMGALNGILIEK